MTPNPLPLVGVSADVKTVEGQPFHAVGDKYLRALTEAAGCAPLIVPALVERLEVPALVERLDGLFLTGSLSNVHPSRYGHEASAEHEPYDKDRDDLTFELIAEALRQKLPLFAVCRGFQELNAALGGTLHPAVHDLPGRLDHRAPEDDDLDLKYGPRHEVTFIALGQFFRRFGELQVEVNSLHRQAIDDLAPGLLAEGFAPDGTVEAVSVKGAEQFALGVQWHPEYKATENPYSLKLFQAFGEAARARASAQTSR